MWYTLDNANTNGTSTLKIYNPEDKSLPPVFQKCLDIKCYQSIKDGILLKKLKLNHCHR